MNSIYLPPTDGRGKPRWKRFAASALAALSLLLLGSAPATAQTISINFVGGSHDTSIVNPMGPTEVAGAVPAANWNNAAGANSGGTPLALVDSTGAATPVSVVWNANGLWSNALADAPGNNRMMKGYLDNSNTSTTTVTVSGLSKTTTYGIYVYVAPFDQNVRGGYSIGTQKYFLTDGSVAPGFDGTHFVQSNSTDSTNPGVGNYVLFSVSGQTSYTVNAQAIPATPTLGDGFRAPVNAMQITVLTAPSAPTNLTAIAADHFVQLNFTGGVGATSYNLYRSTSPGAELAANATPIATAIGSGYRDTTALNGTTYYYAVRGVNTIGSSAPSNEASATPVAAVVGTGLGLEGLFYNGDAGDYSSETGPIIFSYLSPVINYNHANGAAFNPTDWPSGLIAANGGTSDHFTAVWSGMLLAPYTGSYVIQSISDDGSQFSIDLGSGFVQQFTDNTIHGPLPFTSGTLNLVAGHQYPVKLEYLNDTGGYTEQLLYNPLGLGFQIIPQSQLSPTFPAAPGAVTNLTALGGTQSVTLSWTPSLYAATFNIYRGTSAGGESPTPVATNVTGTTYTDTGLTNGVTYFYYIVAVNNVGAGPHSNEASAAPTTPIIGSGDGLFGTYYGGALLDYSAENGTPIAYGIVPTINFNMGNTGVANNPGPFPSNTPATNYTAVWTGQFLAPYTATYNFQINSDDGSRLSLSTDSTNANLAQVVDNSAFQGPTAATTAATNLVAGQKYAIKMEYFQGTGGETAQLLYSIQGSPFQIIPQTQLFSNITTLPSAITDLTAVPYSNSVHLYWSAAPFAITYNVYRGTTTGGESPTPIATGITVSSYTDNTAVNGTTYYYIVKGVNAAGVGPASNEASATPAAVLSVVSFWRFEEGAAGLTVAPGVQLPDSAGHGNTLQTPDPNAAPSYTASVPGNPTTPPLANALAMDFTALAGTGFVARELNTGGATGDINTHAFNQMTIEVSFNPASTGVYQTFLGREGQNFPGDATGGNADLYFQLPDPGVTNAVQVVSIREHQAVDGTFVICNGTTQIMPNQWYNAAAVTDGHSLSLYLQTTPGGAYHLENSVRFNGAVGAQGSNWSLGRGFYGGAPTDRYNGFLDEVRISDNALAPSQFLFAAPTGATVTGSIALEGVADLSAINANAPLGVFDIQIRAVGSQVPLFENKNVTLTTTHGSANGTFSLTVPGLAPGTYDVRIKGSKNLAVLTSGVAISATSGTVPNVLLPGGDTDNNNAVDTTDFGTFVGAYNSNSAVPGSGYDPTADFNFDGLVDATDFGIFVGDYNTAGAP